MKKEVLFIDAISISHKGGGATHICEILKYANLDNYNFDKIYIFASNKLLDKIENNSNLIKISSPFLNKNIFFRYFYIFFILPIIYFRLKPRIIFSLASNFHIIGNLVTINQSLLPFEKDNGNYILKLKVYFKFIKYFNLLAFRKSIGVIFLTSYAQKLISNSYSKIFKKCIIIPHGLSDDITNFQFKINYTISKSVKILYVSSINEYKNHQHVYEAVKKISNNGYKIILDFIGENSIYGQSLLEAINKDEHINLTFNYYDHMNIEDLYRKYPNYDIFVFASIAESFGINILEAMNFALPIACSNKSSMPETIKDACVYFEPNDINSIENAILKIIENEGLRETIGIKARQYSKNYKWSICSIKTFDFLNSFYK